MNFNNYFAPPYYRLGSIIFTDKPKYHMVLMTAKSNHEEREQIAFIEMICKLLNGEIDKKFFKIDVSGVHVYITPKEGDEPYHLIMRGWGFLTGGGSLNLSTETAIEIQDSFLNHFKRSYSL